MSAPRRSFEIGDCQTPLGIAVSGGSDSLALLHMCAEAFPASHLHAVTVDHGLRAEAADEAKAVQNTCRTLGVPHETLTLDMQPGPNLQAAARTARYGALAAWGHQHGLSEIALGHTQDDVAEGFLLRLARGSGVDGLASMQAQTARSGMRFVRPLLDHTRASLQAYLRSKDVVWAEDPSNDDPRFERVKIRRAAPFLAELGLTPERLSDTAKWMDAARETLELAADEWIARHATGAYGDAVLNLAALQDAPDETTFRVLSRALCAISSKGYRPRFSALAQIRKGGVMTLHGCLIYPHKATLRITREVKSDTQNLDPRWTITGPFEAGDTLRPLGAAGLAQIKNWRDTAVVPRRSLLASPSVWRAGTLVAAPLARPDPDWCAEASNPLHLSK